MKQDHIWPPPPVPRAEAKVKCSGVNDPFGRALGAASLVLTLPGMLLVAFGMLNDYALYWKALERVAESLGFCAGVLGWRFPFGKLGSAAAMLHYGFVFVDMWWINPL